MFYVDGNKTGQHYSAVVETLSPHRRKVLGLIPGLWLFNKQFVCLPCLHQFSSVSLTSPHRKQEIGNCEMSSIWKSKWLMKWWCSSAMNWQFVRGLTRLSVYNSRERLQENPAILNTGEGGHWKGTHGNRTQPLILFVFQHSAVSKTLCL